MRIFITGGTGFIGRRVVPLLKKRKHTVWLMKARLAETAKIEKELRRFKPDVMIHLAWEGLPDYGPATSAKNVVYGLQLFSTFSKLGIKKIISTGSCSEYDSKDSGHWTYTIAKRTLREIGTALFSQSGSVFVWAVPFFIYGVGKPGGSLVPSLITQAQRGEIPVAKNDVYHDFVYVNDVVRALVFLTEKKIPSGVYDIGLGKLTRTVEIACTIARAYHIPFAPVRTMHKKRGRVADLRALKKLGWRPEFSIRKGVKAMMRELHG